MISQTLKSVRLYFEAIPLISELKLWKYVALSAIISLAVAAFAFWLSFGLGDWISNFLGNFYSWEKGKGVFGKIIDWISTGLLALGFVFILRYLLIVILAPIMSFLSEEVEEKYTGYKINSGFDLSKAGSDMIRGIRLAIRNISRELLLTALFFVLGFFPIFAPFSVIAILLVQAYYAGFGNIDYYLERHLSIRESVHFMKRNKGMALGNGGMYLLLLFIPVIGVIFAPVLSTISGTIHAIDEGV